MIKKKKLAVKKKVVAKKKSAPRPKAKVKAKPKKAAGKSKSKKVLVAPRPRLSVPSKRQAAALSAPPAESAPRVAQSVAPPKEKGGPAETLALLAAETAHDKKAIDVIVLDLRGISPVSDFMVIAGAKSAPQLFSLADSIEEALSKVGQKPSHRERSRLGDPDWILMDYFDVMVHVMMNEARGHYQLERLYSKAKVVAEYNDN